MVQAKENSQRYFYWFSFLMAFPAIVIFFNLSIYFFIGVWTTFREKYYFNLSLKPIEAKLALLFAIGISISLFDVWSLSQGWMRVENGLNVWLNYIYWAILIIFLTRHAHHLDFELISKAVFFGLVVSLIYFFVPVIKDLRVFDIFKSLQQNILSFILLTFGPLALVYVFRQYGQTMFFIAGIGIAVLAFLTGSRSGSILVTLGVVVMMLYVIKGDVIFALPVFILGFIILVAYSNNSLPGLIKELNPRTHSLIYNRGDVLTSDFSYLTRLAIQRKGLTIYAKNPITGVGINNFIKYKAKIKYDFKGGDLIEHDDKFIQKASAHNSYLSILVETGLVGFLPFVALLGVIYGKLIICLVRFKMDPIGVSLATGLTCMLIHLYFISAILNIFAWFFIGIVSAYNYQKRASVARIRYAAIR